MLVPKMARSPKPVGVWSGRQPPGFLSRVCGLCGVTGDINPQLLVCLTMRSLPLELCQHHC